MQNRPLEEWEYPEPDETDDDWDDDQVPCPVCGESIYSETERCPHCGDYVVFSRDPLGGRPNWFVWMGLAGIAAVVLLLGCPF